MIGVLFLPPCMLSDSRSEQLRALNSRRCTFSELHSTAQ
uniref:Uncharacterized protein n=1 Tax=Arundo donax TaxID=35708 RepID=A0A0A8ZAD6_ARUDO